MATTLTDLKWTRRTLTGLSGPQPLAGTAARAAEACAAMSAAPWTEGGEPRIPAHKVKTAVPSPGDAYRQTWGYDAATSTERSACGAVCYSFKLPDEALTGDPCAVNSLSATLAGDRWLECGAILTALVSAESVPPSFGDFVENAESTAALLIPADTDGQGRTIEPNKRADTSATVTLAFATPPAAAQWLHVMLRVADYTTVRGAWHEGGAMLDPDSVSVTFSRDVTPDASDAVTTAWLAPERDEGDRAALSRTGAIFAVAGWPTGYCAGLAGETLWGAVADVAALPYIASGEDDPTPYNSHTMSRLHRWRQVSGRDAVGDWALVGATAETWAGQTYPWVTGLVMGQRVRVPDGKNRVFTTLSFGAVPPVPLRVRIALYVSAEQPQIAEGAWRNSTPDPAACNWAALWDGIGSSIAFSGAEGLPIQLVRVADYDLSGGLGTIPAPVTIQGAATLIAFVRPLALEGYTAVRWPVGAWTLS